MNTTERAATAPAAGPPGAGRRDARHVRELVVHLALREIASAHRFTLLGWLWPLVRQLAQLAVLVIVFSTFLDLGIQHFGIFVFSGIVVWSWFSTSVSAASGSIVDRRHLVFQPGFPTVALPVVATAVPLVDLLMALPVLVAMVAVRDLLSWAVVLLPALVAIQFTLTCGIAWAVGAITVFLRDTQNIVLVGLTMLFYLTPVFYELDVVPEPYSTLLNLNPLVPLLGAYRSVLMEGRVPDATTLLGLVGAAAVSAALGLALFRAVRHAFVDEL